MSHNTWIHRMVRVAMRPLAHTPVTPNHVTTVRLAAGIAAALALAEGSDQWRHIGAGVFFLSVFLDRADGELARLSGKTSSLGHKYDLVSDALCNGLAFVGLGFGLSTGPYGDWAPVMGGIAGIAVAVILWLVLALEGRQGARAGELGGLAGFDPDDAVLLVPVAIWAGLADELLLAAVLGTPFFAVFMIARFRRTLREAGSYRR